ncbi:MAG: hypothetical protein JWM89_1300 [Acidimicrobiales bacterium]|nr:hypothetical protein [Acidimicrobiales bacterium]
MRIGNRNCYDLALPGRLDGTDDVVGVLALCGVVERSGIAVTAGMEAIDLVRLALPGALEPPSPSSYLGLAQHADQADVPPAVLARVFVWAAIAICKGRALGAWS